MKYKTNETSFLTEPHSYPVQTLEQPARQNTTIQANQPKCPKHSAFPCNQLASEITTPSQLRATTTPANSSIQSAVSSRGAQLYYCTRESEMQDLSARFSPATKALAGKEKKSGAESEMTTTGRVAGAPLQTSRECR